MNRRDTAIALASLGLLAASRVARSQPAQKKYRFGFLATSPPEGSKALLAAFIRGLAQHGYAEGANFAVEHRWTVGSPDRLDSLAGELIQHKVDVILAWGTPAVGAAKRAAAAKTPIVMVGVGDPVGAGFISSLGRPGGNITGVSNISTDLSGKVLAYLLAIVPDAKRVGILRNPGNPVAKLQLSESERAAQALGVQLLLFDARQPGDLDAAFERMARERVAGFVALADPMFISQRSRIAELAMRLRLPSAFARKENVDVGGLISYGPDLADQFFRAAYYVHRILQGTLPSALPVEEPAKLVLAVNLKTAATLGVTVPRITLLAADVVIQ